MINWIIIYLFIGLRFGLFVENGNERLNPNNEELRLNWIERILMIILWPFTMSVFVITFIREYFK